MSQLYNAAITYRHSHVVLLVWLSILSR